MDEMKRYRCLVIDDESHAIELLSDYIEAIPRLQLIKTYQDPLAALMACRDGESYDFIFMDIDMPHLTGIELAKSLRSCTTFLVFTTAHPKYALEAFDVRADHFLLKPISMNKFAVTVDLLLKSKEEQVAKTAPPDNSFYIKSDQKGKLIKVCLDDLIFVEGLKNYVMLHTSSQRLIAYLTMKEVEVALNRSSDFIRVHKSFIVAKKHIEGVNGRVILMKGNKEVMIGDTYKKNFTSYIQEKIFLSGR